MEASQYTKPRDPSYTDSCFLNPRDLTLHTVCQVLLLAGPGFSGTEIRMKQVLQGCCLIYCDQILFNYTFTEFCRIKQDGMHMELHFGARARSSSELCRSWHLPATGVRLSPQFQLKEVHTGPLVHSGAGQYIGEGTSAALELTSTTECSRLTILAPFTCR